MSIVGVFAKKRSLTIPLPQLNNSLYFATFSCVYFLMAELGHILSDVESNFAAVWMPSGLLLAAFVIAKGFRRIFLTIIAAVFANAISDVGFHDKSIWVSACFVSVNIIEALLGASAYKIAFALTSHPRGLKEFLLFLSLCAAIPPLVSASFAGILISNLYGEPYFWVALKWWISSFLGISLVTPFVLATAHFAKSRRIEFRLGNLLDRLIPTLTLFVLSFLVFSHQPYSGGPRPPTYALLYYVFVIFPALTWTCLKNTRIGSSFASLVVSIICLYFTTLGAGPLINEDKLAQNVVVCFFIASVAFTSQMISAVNSERDDKELALRVSENKFRSLTQNSSALVFTVNLNGQTVFANTSMLYFLGKRLSDINRLESRVHIDDRDLFMKTIKNALVTGEGGNVIVRFVNRFGKYRRIELQVDCISGVDSEITGLVASGFDATDLVEARELAEQLNQAKGELMANISHEIRTPISALISLSDLSLSLAEDRTQREYLSLIKESSGQLLEIANEVLDQATIESGKFELHESLFKLDDAIASAAEQFSIVAERKGICFVVDIMRNVPTNWMGDSQRLRQILSNLVSNAIKYTDKGTVVLRASFNEERVLRLEVHDTGVGMSANYQKKAFQPFQRDHHNSDGTGLGLSIVAHLVHLMGGKINLISEEKKGTSFFIDLPARATVATSAENRFSSEKKDIVIICTERNLSASVEHNFQRFGVKTSTFASMQDFLDKPPPSIDLIVLHVTSTAALKDAITKLQGQSARRAKIIPMAAPSIRVAIQKEFNLRSSLPVPCLQKHVLEILQTQQLRAQQHTSKIDPSGSVQNNLRILLVEDNDINAMISHSQLSKYGYSVVSVKDGDIAVARYKDDFFDVVLMDVELPTLSGVEASRAIRRYEIENQLNPTIIIGITAHSSSAKINECIHSGMNAVLPKPLDMKELLKLISAHHITNTPNADLEPKIYGATATVLRSLRQNKGPDAINDLKRQIKSYLPEITRSYRRNELDEMRRIAHKLAGALSFFQSSLSYDIAQQLSGLSDQDEDQAAALIDQLAIEIQLLMLDLARFDSGLQNSLAFD